MFACFTLVILKDTSFVSRIITLGLVIVVVRIWRLCWRIWVFNYVKRAWAYISIDERPLFLLRTSLNDQNLWRLLLFKILFLHHCLNRRWCTNDSPLRRFGLLDDCLTVDLRHFVIWRILILAVALLGSLGLLLLADWCRRKLRRMFLGNRFYWGEVRACDLINSWHHDVLHWLEIAGNRAVSLNCAIECLLLLL